MHTNIVRKETSGSTNPEPITPNILISITESKTENTVEETEIASR